MRSLMISFTLVILIIMSATSEVKGQNGPQKPETFIDPDHDTFFMIGLDSVVQFSYPDISDSTRLNKWEYSRNSSLGILTSFKFTWAPEERVYHLNQRYETGFDENGQQTSQTHYYHNWAMDRWWGCASDGCGKKEWTYDKMGNQTMFTQSYWSKNQKEWIRFNQLLNEYDQYGNQTLMAQFSRDQVGNPWMGQFKYEYSYNSDNLEWGAIYYRWDRLKQDWYFQAKSLSEYPDQQTTLITQYNYSQTELEWSENGKIKRVAELNDSVETNISYDWDEQLADWRAYSKQIYHFNPAGLSTLYCHYTWHTNQTSWVPWFRSEKEYDSAGRLSMEVAYIWSQTDRIWVGRINQMVSYGKRTYQYNDDGQLWLYTNYDWDIEKGNWIGQDDGLIELIYDLNGMIQEEIRYDWDLENEEWIQARKTSISYNSSGQVDYQTKYAWDTDLQEWIQVLRYFFYSSGSTAIHDFAQSDLKVYPNPCDGILNISGWSDAITIKIFTLQGQLIKSLVTESEQIDLSDLSIGVYTLYIHDLEMVFSQKLVIQ